MALPPDYLVLDAYGVLWEPGQDIELLLAPYLRAHGVHVSDAQIHELYRAASLGLITSGELWQRYGLEGDHDAEYLAGLSLVPGVTDILAAAATAGVPVAVLSNDVREWSLYARERFGLTRSIEHWVIGADVGARKPDPAIYRAFAAATGWSLDRCLFVDDRVANLDTARDLGMQTALLNLGGATSDPNGHRAAHLIRRWGIPWGSNHALSDGCTKHPARRGCRSRHSPLS